MQLETQAKTIELNGEQVASSNQSAPVPAIFPAEGYVRLPSILKPSGPLPISRSTWWLGVKEGRYPPPVKLGPRVTAWRAADIIALMERFEREVSNDNDRRA